VTAVIDIAACREVFLELQQMMLVILRLRQKQGTSHSRSLHNAQEIRVMREGSKIVLIWHNSNSEQGLSRLEFRRTDRLTRWLCEHVLGRSPSWYGNSRRTRNERNAARKRKLRSREYYASIDLGQLAQELCTSEHPLPRPAVAEPRSDKDPSNANAA